MLVPGSVHSLTPGDYVTFFWDDLPTARARADNTSAPALGDSLVEKEAAQACARLADLQTASNSV